MQIAKLIGNKKLSITSTEFPIKTEDKTVIRVSKVGICGSDLHQWQEGDEFKGLIMGHEFSGIIEESGKSELKKGDRVTVNPVMPCKICEHCLSGNTNLCGDEAIGCNLEYPGAYSEYVAVDPSNVYKIDDSISDEAAAMVEPAAVAHHAIEKLNVTQRDKVLVAGSGIIGLLVASIAKSKGAQYVAITDINQTRLELAKKSGVVDDVFNATDSNMFASSEKASEGFSKFFDCVGISASINNGLKALNPKGKAALIGVNFHPTAIDTYPILVKEIQIHGINCYTNQNFTEALQLITDKKINVQQFITKHINLEDIQTAFEELSTGQSNDIKVMIDFSKRGIL